MEPKVCPSLCASASAAEFRVLPARRESSSKALSEPSEMLKYLWVFPLSCRPTLLSLGPLISPVGGEGPQNPSRQYNPAPDSPHPGQNPNLLRASQCQGFLLSVILKTIYLLLR